MSTTHLLEAGVRDARDLLPALAARVTALYEHPVYRRLAGDLHTPALALHGASATVGSAAVHAVRAALASFEEASLASSELPERLRAMRPAVASARTLLERFADAWSQLPEQLAECGRQLAALRGSAPNFAGQGRTLARRLEALASSAANDPLGTVAALTSEIEPTLRRLALEQAAAERQRASVATRLAALPARLTELRTTLANAAGRVAERDARILDLSAPLLPTPLILRTLAVWRDRLDATAAAGRWETAARSLTAWEERVDEFAAACRTAVRLADEALAERRRLRGWLRALQAQAGALRLSESPRFSAAALEAQRLLLTPPTQLTRVAGLLAQCQALLHRHEC